jgi:NAD(P)-dependent dehydrogenase (short-subunit alcohol dehydrogenase family)
LSHDIREGLLSAAAWLASDEARVVTGAGIIVDGGMVARCD